MGYEMKHIQGSSNIVQNTQKVETARVNPQTWPLQHFEARTNTNMRSNRFTHTQPMQYAEASTNTNFGNNGFSQTQPI